MDILFEKTASSSYSCSRFRPYSNRLLQLHDGSLAAEELTWTCPAAVSSKGSHRCEFEQDSSIDVVE